MKTKITFESSFLNEIIFPSSLKTNLNPLNYSNIPILFSQSRVSSFLSSFMLKKFSSETEIVNKKHINNFSKYFSRPMSNPLHLSSSLLDSHLLSSLNLLNYPQCIFKTPNKILKSPVEGQIVSHGKLIDSSFNLKKSPFNLSPYLNFLKPAFRPNSKTGFYYILYYLSPSDYHRFHAPAELTIDRLAVSPGKTQPMTPIYSHFVSKLPLFSHINNFLFPSKKNFKNIRPKAFIDNRKFIAEGLMNGKGFGMISIGSKNVGSVFSDYSGVGKEVYEEMDCMGGFRVDGSAVLVVFEDAGFEVRKGLYKVRLGESVGSFK